MLIPTQDFFVLFSFLKVFCMPFQHKVGGLQLQAVKFLQPNFREN